MLTGRGICGRSTAKMSPLFHKTRRPYHGTIIHTFRAATIEQLNCREAFERGTIISISLRCSNSGVRCNETRAIRIDCSSSPLLCQSNSQYLRSTTSGVSRATTGGQFVRTMATMSNGGPSHDKDARLRVTALRLYRILQRMCGRLVPTSEGTIFLQNDISASDWGHYSFHDNRNNADFVTADQTEELVRLFLVLSGTDPISGISKENDWYDELTSLIPNIFDKNTNSSTCWTTPANLRKAIHFAFRSSASLSSQSPLELQTLALRATQVMGDQLKLWNQSSAASTSNGLVRVTATSRCLGTVSPMSMNASYSPLTPKYRFAYRIRVENVSASTTVQLLGRYWHIAEEHDNSDNDGSSPEPIEVDAPYTGAVGQLPVLQPGQAFEYVSGTDLTTPRGEMMGHLYMATVPPHTRSAKSGDTVTAASCHGLKASSASSSASAMIDDENSTQTTLFHAAVKPFRLESFEQ